MNRSKIRHLMVHGLNRHYMSTNHTELANRPSKKDTVGRLLMLNVLIHFMSGITVSMDPLIPESQTSIRTTSFAMRIHSILSSSNMIMVTVNANLR